jgi:YHS domain-containing protein
MEDTAMRLFIISATLVALAACSTEDRLLAPDHEANRIVSKENDNRKPRRMEDPVCGQPLGGAEYTWHSSHDGHEFYFDSESCKKQFDANPELYSTTAR